MSLILSDFMDIINQLLIHGAWFFKATNEAILISSPVEISLFAAMFGFVILEFILFTLNRLRGLEVPATSNGKIAQGKPNQYGGFGDKSYGPQIGKGHWRGGRRG